MLVTNSQYDIRTKNGFEHFSGIQVRDDRKTVCVVLEDGYMLNCTTNHKLMTPFGYVEIRSLYEGDVVETIDGFKKIIRVSTNIKHEDVYDILDAGSNYQYYANGILSKNCEFIGSTNTLIHPSILKRLRAMNPIGQEDMLDIYEHPQLEHVYAMTVDVAEGQNLDSSTFSVFDVTSLPYRQVAKFKDNTITPLLFPSIIYHIANRYNEAFVLVEINTIGLQVADILHFELNYENLIKLTVKGKQGQQATPGFTKKIAYGIKTSVQTKKIGCANLKTLIETDKLIINDTDTIMELTTFSAHKQSFAAEEGNNDDLVMTLVHFAWLTAQRFFKESVKSDVRQSLQKEQLALIDQTITPFGLIDGYGGADLEELEASERDKNGDIWLADRSKFYPFDSYDSVHNRWNL